MLTTEKEMTKKWCPWGRTAQLHRPQSEKKRFPWWLERAFNDWFVVSINRFWDTSGERHKEQPWTFCFGSRCAAWRWGGYFDSKGKQILDATGKDASGEMYNPAEINPLNELERSGYCGRAGRPE